MDAIQLLSRQTKDTYEWVNKIVDSIPENKWELIPEGIASNVSWQVGHLTISFYFHSIMVIVGHKKDIMATVPMRQYGEIFTYGTPKDALGQFSAEVLKSNMNLLMNRSLEVIESLELSALDQPLEPTRVPHPVAATKFEALDWNIKHTMWHVGQLGMLKRAVDERYNFGLQKA